MVELAHEEPMTVGSRGRNPLNRLSPMIAGGAAALAIGLAAGNAEAQARTPPITNGGGFDLRLFRPAVDSKGQFTVNGTDILGAWDVAFGLVMDYGRNLARIGAPEN